MSHILSSRDPEHVRFLTSALDLKALLYSKADQRQGRCLIGSSAIRVAALKCKAEKHSENADGPKRRGKSVGIAQLKIIVEAAEKH